MKHIHIVSWQARDMTRVLFYDFFNHPSNRGPEFSFQKFQKRIGIWVRNQLGLNSPWYFKASEKNQLRFDKEIFRIAEEEWEIIAKAEGVWDKEK